MENFDLNAPIVGNQNNIPYNQTNPEENTLQDSFDLNSVEYTPNSFIKNRYEQGKKQWSVFVTPLLEDFNRHGFNYTPDQDMYKILTEAQSNSEKFGNAIGQAIVNEIGLGTLAGLADIFIGLPKLIATGEYNNAVSETIRGWQDKYEQDNTIYVDPNKNISNGGLTDFGWWCKNIPSIVSTISLLIPSTAAVKGIGLIGKIGKLSAYGRRGAYALAKGVSKASKGAIHTHSAYNAIKTGIELTAMAGLQRFGENYQEAQQVYKDTNVYAKQRLNNMSDEEYRQYIENNKQLFEENQINTSDRNAVADFIAKESADRTFAYDWSNAFFDVLQMYTLRNVWKGVSQGANMSRKSKKAWDKLKKYVGKTESEIEQINKSTAWYKKLGEKAKDALTTTTTATAAELSEGLEEAINYIAQEEGLTYGKILLGDVKDYGFNNRMSEYMKSPELYESAFWGVLGGVVFQGLGSGMGRLKTAIQRKTSEIKDSELKRKDGSFVDYFLDNDTKRNIAAASRVANDFNNTINVMKAVNETANEPITVNGEQTNVSEQDKENVKQKIFDDFITRRAKDAIESGNIEDFREFVQSEEVQKYFVEQGLATEEEAKSMATRVNDIIEHTQTAYNNAFDKLFGFARIIEDNSDKYKDNPFGSTGIPAEYLEILTNKEFYENEEILSLNERIERNRANLTKETPNHDSNSFRDKFYRAVKNDNRLTEDEKTLLLSQDMISVVETYMSMGYLANMKDRKRTILKNAKKEKRNLNINEEQEIEDLNKQINTITADLGLNTTQGFYNILNSTFGITGLYKENSKRFQFVNDILLGSPLGNTLTASGRYQIDSVRQVLKEEIDKVTNLNEKEDKEYKEILEELSNVFNQDYNIVFNAIQDYYKNNKSYNAYSKLSKILEKEGLFETLNKEVNELYSSELTSLQQLVADKIKLKALQNVQINTPDEFFEKVKSLHKNFETAADTAINKAKSTITSLYKDHYDKANEIRKAVFDKFSGYNVDIKSIIPELTDEDVKQFDDAIKVIQMRNPERKQLYYVLTSLYETFDNIDKSMRQSQELNNTNQNPQNQSQNENDIIIPDNTQNGSESQQASQNDILQPSQTQQPTTEQQAQNNNQTDNTIDNEVTRAAFKFDENPTAILSFDKNNKPVINKNDNIISKTDNTTIVLRQSSINDNVYEVDVQSSSSNLLELFETNNGAIDLSSPENYVVKSRPIIMINNDGFIDIAKGELVERTNEPQQFMVPLSEGIDVYPHRNNTQINVSELKQKTNEIINEEVYTLDVPSKEQQNHDEVIGKAIRKFLKNIDNITDENLLEEFNKFISENYPDVTITNEYIILLKDFYNYDKKRNGRDSESISNVVEINNIHHSVIRANPTNKALKYYNDKINKLAKSIITKFANDFKLVTAEVNGETRTFINTHQLYNYVKSITNEEIADNVYALIVNYINNENNTGKVNKKYYFTNQDVIKINKSFDNKTINTELDVNINDVNINDLQDVQPGDVLTTKQTDSHTLTLYKNNKVVGSLFIPTKITYGPEAGTYKGSINRLQVNIRQTNNGLYSRLMSDFIYIFDDLNNPYNKYFIQLLTTYTYSKNAQEKQDILNKIIQTDIYEHLLENNKAFTDDDTDSDAITVNGLSGILRYINYEFGRNGDNFNYSQYAVQSIKNWFTKLYNSYDAIYNLAGTNTGTVTVSNINEGSINRTDVSKDKPNDLKETIKKSHPDYDTEKINFVYSNGSHYAKETGVSNDTTTVIPAAPGNTGIIFTQRNGTVDYVPVRSKSVHDVYNTQGQNPEIKELIDNIKTYICNVITDYVNGKDNMTIDELYEKLKYVLPANKDNSGCSLLRGLLISKTKWGYSIGITGQPPLYINSSKSISYKGNTNINKITDIITELINNATFDISFSLMKHQNSGIVSFDIAGKMYITIPSTGELNKTLTYNSYGEFLFNNSCCNAWLSADKDGNIYSRSNNTLANQVLRVTINNAQTSSTSSPVEENGMTTTIAKSDKQVTIDNIKKVINDTKSNKGIRIARLVIANSNKNGNKLNGKVNDIIKIFEKYNLLSIDNIVYYNNENYNEKIGNPDEFNAAYDNGKIYLTDRFFEMIEQENTPYQALKVLLHENLHALLSQEDNKYYISQIKEVYEIFKNAINNTEDKATYSKYLFDESSDESEVLDNELDRLEEFLVESLTSEELAKKLNEINVNGEKIKEGEKSLFQKIMEFLSNIFNFNINENSLYAKEFNLLADFMTTKQETTENNTQEEINEQQEESDDLDDLSISFTTGTKRSTIKIDGYTEEMIKIKEESIANGTFMKAPNGEESNLNERQWLQVRTKNFKNWFGDWENNPKDASKIVDENGEPLVVYHGTDKKFDIFSFDNFGKTDGGTVGKGFYFTPNKANASLYGKNIIEVFLNVRNLEKLAGKNYTINDLMMQKRTFGDEWWWNIQNNDEHDLKDGILVDNLETQGINTKTNLGYEYIVRNHNQIKSATDNDGSFSKTNNSIKHSTIKISNQNKTNIDINSIEFYSGGAIGSDKAWANAATKLGIKIKEYTIKDWDNLSTEWKNKLNDEYLEVVKILDRKVLNSNIYSGKLVRRDMMQADKADAIFAIGTIASNGYIDGGTGYAATRGIIRGIPVYLFDQKDNEWKVWNGKEFVKTNTPIITKNAALIGTRDLQSSGQNAINSIFESFSNYYFNNNNDNIDGNIVDIVKDSKNYTISYYNNVPNQGNNIIFADSNIINNSDSKEEIVYHFVDLLRQANENKDKFVIIPSSEDINKKLPNKLTEKDIMILFKEAMKHVDNIPDNIAVSKSWIASGFFDNIRKADEVKKQYKVTKSDVNIETSFDNEYDLYNQLDTIQEQQNLRRLVNSAAISIKC